MRKIKKFFHNARVKFYWNWVYPFWLAKDAVSAFNKYEKEHPEERKTLTDYDLIKFFTECIWGNRERFFTLVTEKSTGYLWIMGK